MPKQPEAIVLQSGRAPHFVTGVEAQKLAGVKVEVGPNISPETLKVFLERCMATHRVAVSGGRDLPINRHLFVA